MSNNYTNIMDIYGEDGVNLMFENKSFVNYTFIVDPLIYEKSLPVLLIFCVLFIVAAVGNLTVFVSLFKFRHRKSRISLMISHLAIADLLVTFIMIPLEIGWRLTVQWLAGNMACKALLYLRAFGLYLSSNVLVCVSLDRYFAVLHPLKVNDARRRGKSMLAWAWGVSLVCAIPQSIVFHEATHPQNPNFVQCVTFGFFTSRFQQIAYNLFGLTVMYFVPLMVIIVAYTAIMLEIYNKSKTSNVTNDQREKGRLQLRRSDISNIDRARTRTLRMTITIVVVFVICWTPYVIITLWYTFEPETAQNVPGWLQDTLFMMAVSNSCMNPLVYGSYAINFKNDCQKCICCAGKNVRSPLVDNGSINTRKRCPEFFQQVINLFRPESGSATTRSSGMHRVVEVEIHTKQRGKLNCKITHQGDIFDFDAKNRIVKRNDHFSFLSEPHGNYRTPPSFISDPFPFESDNIRESSASVLNKKLTSS